MLTPVQIVEWGNAFALPGWIILIFFPRRWGTLAQFPEMVVPFVFGFVYTGIMLAAFGHVEGGYNAFIEIKALFENDYLLAAGWIHYLAFNLFVGTCIAKRSDEIGLSRLIQAPILGLTFMFGPGGFALFIAARWALFAMSSRAPRS